MQVRVDILVLILTHVYPCCSLWDATPTGSLRRHSRAGDLTIGEDNFGIDDYEPRFFYRMGELVEAR
jgi:hypothetical protein